MFSLKCLTKKFNRQSLSEVKPAPPSETVDHTSTPSPFPFSSKSSNASISTSIYAAAATAPTTSPFAPVPMSDTTDHTLSMSNTPILQDHPNHFTHSAIAADGSAFASHVPPAGYRDGGEDGDVDDDDDIESSNSTHFLPSSLVVAAGAGGGSSPGSGSSRNLSLSSPPLSCPSPSNSDSDSEDNEDGAPPLPRVKGHPHSPRKGLLKSELKIERISSAEKRKYSQYKCSTASSSPSSSDDEIKEAFDTSSLSRLRHGPLHHQREHPYPHHHHLHHHQQHQQHHPSFSHHAWNGKVLSSCGSPSFQATPSTPPLSSPSATTTNGSPSDQPPLSGWGVDLLEAAGRPLKVLPVGKHKHKFFAQMSSGFSDRPFLDFNKMQHSKRLVMVRRPMVIRNNSRVHSIQRPSPHSFQVSLDISQHSFQPVLT